MEVGSAVTLFDEYGKPHSALVTSVFGGWGPENQPSINVVYVSGDEGRTDQYGRQIERRSSVVHKSNQSASGMYWM
jgi:hypothetical protein